MGGNRLAGIPGFGIDQVAAAAAADPDVLRLENLDTDLRPHPDAVAATAAALDTPEGNSWLPFTGKVAMRAAVARQLRDRSGVDYDPATQIVITCGEGDAMVDALFVTTDPGDEVIVTDPTYAGMINRVRIVSAVPRFTPLTYADGAWHLDLDALRSAVTPGTRALFVANPGMPTGNVITRDEWDAVAAVCREHDLWLIYLAWMEKILYDDREYVHPASLPGMADRVVTVGTVSLEQRMIGWRIGWVAVPDRLGSDIARAHIYNGLTPGGIAQAGAVAALVAPEEDLARAVAEWERRRNVVVEQLEGLPVRRSSGGWSMLVDVGELDLDAAEVSAALLGQKVAATPMTAWGQSVGPRHVRIVYSREPVDRLALLGSRFQAAVARLT
ncbi:MAG: aminotransferase class I/II-fold pyridoxal phosphate-dependent enzyme [Nitriliruptorales bacterium]|nr:aminotransferase class I/II-fold pyridoxal phosphate-dependent enzyme [Nitriliruptorales bacterium]